MPLRALLRGASPIVMLALVMIAAEPAAAQGLPPEESLVRFSRYTAVRDRVIPGYEARELRLGTLVIAPSMDTVVRASDNVLALDTPQISDVALAIQPNVQLRTDWSRRLLSVTARGTIERFANEVSENGEDLEASAYGYQDIGAGGRVRAVARYRQARESRESQNAFILTNRPIRFSETSAALGGSYRFASLLLSGEAGWTRADFADGQLGSGTILDQDYRDGQRSRLRARVELAQSPALSYFIQTTRDRNTYRNDSLSRSNRDSTTLELLAGARFELQIAARGEVGVGYMRANYSDPGFRNFSGLAVNANILFFPSQLTTVTVSAQRSVNESGIVQSTGYVALVGGVQVDHELLRSLILSATVRLERDSFNGVDREDSRLEIGASADYKLNRQLSVRARYDRLDLSSDGVDRYKSFVRNRFSVGLAVKI